jgi:hypothetical protein
MVETATEGNPTQEPFIDQETSKKKSPKCPLPTELPA